MLHVDGGIFPGETTKRLIVSAQAFYDWEEFDSPVNPSPELSVLSIVKIRYPVMLEPVVESGKLLFGRDINPDRFALITDIRVGSSYFASGGGSRESSAET
jgi:hypothetical protein